MTRREERDRWSRVWEIFDRALNVPPPERGEFLKQACPDESLRHEIQSLLRANAQIPEYLDQPVFFEPEPEPEPPGSLIGTRIGPYLIESVAGRGGMGTVYVARQKGEIERRVAIKVIRLGMHTEEVVARFNAERRTLALMNHPNIASVHDVGVTDDGRSFFVMEYVEGISIEEYCDEHSLSIRSRLELLLAVGAAIQHAHQKMIIHRDIKPSNVLVSRSGGVGVPKVIDFGIAKALDRRSLDRTALTEMGEMLGTPEYMSPEQVEGSVLDVDARTDIYSLGVLLYQILTGTLPFDPEELRRSGYSEMHRMIREDDPPTPSARWTTLGPSQATKVAGQRQVQPNQMARLLRGELDWITMKAMDKDRSRRYASVSELMADIRRYLANEPVSAGPPTVAYRLNKFVRRHQLAVASAALFVVVLIAFSVTVSIQSARTARALIQAEEQRERAQQVSEFLVELFEVPDPSVSRGESITAREILDRGSERISSRLGEQPEIRASLMLTMGQVYLNLGLYDSAASLLEDSLQLRREAFGPESIEVADNIHRLGIVRERKGRYEEAEELLRDALAKRRRLHGENHPLVLETLLHLGSVLTARTEYPEAEEIFREAIQLDTQLQEKDPLLSVRLRNQLGRALVPQGEYDRAEDAYSAALELARLELPGDHTELAGLLNNFGAALYHRGSYDRAEALLSEAVEIGRGIGSPLVPTALGNLGLLYQRSGDYGQAEAMYLEALSVHEKARGREHWLVGINLNNLGLVLEDSGDLDGALGYFEEACPMFERLYGKRNQVPAECLNNLARVRHERGDYREAERIYRYSLEVRREVLSEGHPGIASSLTWLGKLLIDTGRAQEAEALLGEALRIRRKSLAADDWRVAETASILGACLTTLARFDEAEHLLVESYTLIKAGRGEKYYRTLDARRRIVALYQAWKRPREAARYLQR